MHEVLKRYKKDRGFVEVEGQDMQSVHPPRQPAAGERLIALDPGRRDVVFGSVSGSNETLHMSTGQLCHESGRRWSKKLSEHIFSKIAFGDITLGEAKATLPSSKTSSLHTWEHFLSSYLPLIQVTLDTWKTKRIRKTAFWCYGKRDKCLDTLCQKITEGKRGTLVAFGGAAACSTGCGYAPVPQKRLRMRLEKVHGARVTLVNEFQTSQICSSFGTRSQCKGRLQNVRINDEKIWALKRCTSCKSSKGTDLIWNRDRNASLNILSIYLHLAEHGDRPDAFKRGVPTERDQRSTNI